MQSRPLDNFAAALPELGLVIRRPKQVHHHYYLRSGSTIIAIRRYICYNISDMSSRHGGPTLPELQQVFESPDFATNIRTIGAYTLAQAREGALVAYVNDDEITYSEPFMPDSIQDNGGRDPSTGLAIASLICSTSNGRMEFRRDVVLEVHTHPHEIDPESDPYKLYPSADDIFHFTDLQDASPGLAMGVAMMARDGSHIDMQLMRASESRYDEARLRRGTSYGMYFRDKLQLFENSGVNVSTLRIPSIGTVTVSAGSLSKLYL